MNRKRKQQRNKQNKQKEEVQTFKYCEVCGINEMKYTCPKCYIKYCSVNCFKQHKENCIPKIEERKEIMKPKRNREEEVKYLSESMKESLCLFSFLKFFFLFRNNFHFD